MEPQFKIVEHALPETPESLYYGDKLRMEYEAWRRSIDPETLAIVDTVQDKVERAVLGLPEPEEQDETNHQSGV